MPSGRRRSVREAPGSPADAHVVRGEAAKIGPNSMNAA
jgi:hypothetical protein